MKWQNGILVSNPILGKVEEVGEKEADEELVEKAINMGKKSAVSLAVRYECKTQ